MEALRNKERVKAQENRVADLLGRNNPPEGPHHAVKVPPIPMQPSAAQKAAPGKHNGAAIVDVQVCEGQLGAKFATAESRSMSARCPEVWR